ncbi:MAG: S8 family serine peptidase, partial [Microcystis sp.]
MAQIIKSNTMNKNVRNVVGLFILINLLLPACRKNSFTDLDLNGLGGEEVVAGIAVKSLPEHVPNELLVKFKSGTTPDQRNTILSNLKAEIRERILTAAMKSAGEKEG